ncbi:hypothetical protein B0A48_06939 [Cryoendolithus antarcticus]|uniref:Lactam utilization protein lamB n=1 Tax=Cryoendolithus antarcticus TaxID=1507870 RepID=A0A1V8T9T0_9PEZI|nr:hypothetical protein B0A48_06939 [Cryoendolithus antarcticus]
MPPISCKVHINVDLGEGYGNYHPFPDDELLPLIDFANIACGFHAGDPLIMSRTVKACKVHNIRMGAHPGLPDLQGFGRRRIDIGAEELEAGCRAVYRAIPPGVAVFGLAGTFHEQVAKEMGLKFFAEAYGDVKWSKDGLLVIDRVKKAWTTEDTKKHILSQLEKSSVTAVTGEEVELPFEGREVTLCCHSDSPGAVDIVTAARGIVDGFNEKHGYT